MIKMINRATAFAVVTLSLLLMTAPAVQAQPGPPDPEARVDRLMTDMKKELKLSDEQEVKLRAIFNEQMTKQREVFQAERKENRESRAAMQETMQKMREDRDAKVKEVLNEEQVEGYGKFMENVVHSGAQG